MAAPINSGTWKQSIPAEASKLARHVKTAFTDTMSVFPKVGSTMPGKVALGAGSAAFAACAVMAPVVTAGAALSIFTMSMSYNFAKAYRQGASQGTAEAAAVDATIQLRSYPSSGVIVDDGRGTYTPDSIRDRRLPEVLDFLKGKTSELPNGTQVNFQDKTYTVGDGSIFTIEHSNLPPDQKLQLLKFVAADLVVNLVVNPVIDETKMKFLESLIAAFQERNDPAEGLTENLHTLATISHPNFTPVSHDHGVFNPQYHLTFIYDGKGHASATTAEAKHHKDVHKRMDTEIAKSKPEHLANMQFKTMDEAITDANYIFKHLTGDDSFSTGPCAVTKCITINGQTYAMMVQTADAACGIIDRSGKLKPLVDGPPPQYMLSDQIKPSPEPNDGFIQCDLNQGAFAIVKVEPGEELLSFSDGIGEFLTQEEFQNVLGKNTNRNTLGEKLRDAVRATKVESRAVGYISGENVSPNLIGNSETKRWCPTDENHYDDITVISQVVPTAAQIRTAERTAAK